MNSLPGWVGRSKTGWVITTWHPFFLVGFNLCSLFLAREAELMARESDFVLLIPLLDSASKNETHSCCSEAVLFPCNFLVVVFLPCSSCSVSSSSCRHSGPHPCLHPSGPRRRLPLHLRTRPASKEGPVAPRRSKAGLGAAWLLEAVPTAWVRLGAQPAGPIPRFALIIPDPDDPPSLRYSMYMKYVYVYVGHAQEQIMLPLSPSRGPPQQTITTRAVPTGQQTRHERHPTGGPGF